MDMALSRYGIEGRAPLLDHRVVEWADGLAESDLVRGTEKKVFLRDAYAQDLPLEVLNRPKRGFGGPVGKWLEGPLRELVEGMLPCPLLEAGPQQNLRGQRQWTLLSLACWARQWRATW
jgi:asparagine synthase (glutamine-hydrolysing)